MTGPPSSPKDASSRVLGNVRVVLVRPRREGNVGAAARAMLNMGLDDLVLVAPRFDRRDPVRWVAHGAEEVIERMRTMDTLDDAVADCTVAVATTARRRRWRSWPVLDPPGAARLLHQACDESMGALVFGPEDTGLDNTELARCSHLVHIPTARSHTSLNLAQAVLVMVYELFRHASAPPTPRRRVPADAAQVDGAVEQLTEVLDHVGFFRGRNRLQVQTTARQILTRTELTREEIGFVRGVMRKLSWGLEQKLDD